QKARIAELARVQALPPPSPAVDERQLAPMLVAALKALGAKVGVDTKHVDQPVVMVDLTGTKITNDLLPLLAGLPGLRSLSLSSTAISDEGLVHLRRLTRLQVLNLYDTKISDAGLIHLKD